MRILISITDKELSEADIEKLGSDLANKLAFDLQTELKRAPPLGTPVDEGTARAGWDLDTSGPSPIVQNNVEYIGYLNDGHSDKSPAGFVETAIDKIVGRTK